jgi:uncharacterized protein
MNYIAAYTFVMELLENQLPKHLYYHNPPHTVDVVQAAESIARQNNLDASDIQLVRTAALFHDTGLTITYKGHEEASIDLANKYLPGFGYEEHQIDTIARLIMATKMPQSPTCKLSEVLCDADLDYLGRPDYFAVSHRLRLEWIYAMHYDDSLLNWYLMQHDFLTHHNYFTATSRQNRNEGKKVNLGLIAKLLGKD